MPRTDDIILPKALLQSHSLEYWAKKAGLEQAEAHNVWKSATYIVQELKESGTPPPVAMHTMQITFMLICAACKLDRATASDFWNTFAEEAWGAAERFTATLPKAGETVSHGVSYDHLEPYEEH